MINCSRAFLLAFLSMLTTPSLATVQISPLDTASEVLWDCPASAFIVRTLPEAKEDKGDADLVFQITTEPRSSGDYQIAHYRHRQTETHYQMLWSESFEWLKAFPSSEAKPLDKPLLLALSRLDNSSLSLGLIPLNPEQDWINSLMLDSHIQSRTPLLVSLIGAKLSSQQQATLRAGNLTLHHGSSQAWLSRGLNVCQHSAGDDGSSEIRFTFAP